MTTPFSPKQGIFTAQALLKSMGHGIAVDGLWGPASAKAFSLTRPRDKENLLLVVGTVNKDSAAALSKSTDTTPKKDFDKVVSAIVKEAERRSLSNPLFYVAQIALETGWGKHLPKGSSGSNSWNYAGLKANSVAAKVSKYVTTGTTEVYNGVAVKENASFAVFESPEHFAEVYFWYLFDGPSSYRYVGVEDAESARHFGEILQQNGYATDPDYSRKIASVVRRAERLYG